MARTIHNPHLLDGHKVLGALNSGRLAVLQAQVEVEVVCGRSGVSSFTWRVCACVCSGGGGVWA